MFLNGACYIRVSTDDQTEFSPDAQLKLIKKYAKANNIILTKEHIFIDEGISGRSAEKRPEFMRMIATAKLKPKPFDIILVHKFDRFARSREDSVVYKSLLRKECDIKVTSITESIEDDKFSVILEAMLEAMAEYYSLNLSEEVKKGMTEKAERGEFQSVPPFGYDMINKQLVPNPNEADWIRFAFENFANGTMSMRQLAIHFNDLGIKTHRGNQFEARHFEYFFHNPVYIGKVRWTPTHKRSRYDYNNPDIILRDSTHEPLICMELWEQVQKRSADLKQIYRYRERTTKTHKTWLSGLVKCSNCGKSLVVQGDKYLQCNGYVKTYCNVSSHVKYSIIEDLVLEKLKETFKGKLSIAVSPREQNNNFDNYEEKMLTELLERLSNRETRIKTAYQDGIDTLEEYKQNKKAIQEEREKVIESLEALKKQIIDNEESVTTDVYEHIESVFHLLSDPNIDMETKYQTAHFLIDKIIFNKKEKTLKILYK